MRRKGFLQPQRRFVRMRNTCLRRIIAILLVYRFWIARGSKLLKKLISDWGLAQLCCLDRPRNRLPQLSWFSKAGRQGPRPHRPAIRKSYSVRSRASHPMNTALGGAPSFVVASGEIEIQRWASPRPVVSEGLITSTIPEQLKGLPERVPSFTALSVILT